MVTTILYTFFSLLYFFYYYYCSYYCYWRIRNGEIYSNYGNILCDKLCICFDILYNGKNKFGAQSLLLPPSKIQKMSLSRPSHRFHHQSRLIPITLTLSHFSLLMFLSCFCFRSPSMPCHQPGSIFTFTFLSFSIASSPPRLRCSAIYKPFHYFCIYERDKEKNRRMLLVLLIERK